MSLNIFEITSPFGEFVVEVSGPDPAFSRRPDPDETLVELVGFDPTETLVEPL